MTIAATNSDRALVELGRYRVKQTIMLLLGTDLIVTFYYITALGTDRLLQQAGRLVIAILLCLALYRGANWARWVIFVLALLGAVALGPLALGTLRDGITAGSLFLALLTVTYIAIGRIMLWSKPLRAFLAAQRSSRSTPDPAAA